MRIFFAPMEGVVDHHMRHLITNIGGIDICVTEFIRVTDHVLPRKVFLRYCPELATDQKKPLGAVCPTRIQLLGSNAKALAANAAKAAHLGAPAIDLNFGCPAKTVNKNKGGACLLDETELIFEIVSEVRNSVPKHIPVTAKIRLGFNDRDSFLNNAKAIEEAGANELIVHARSKADGYRPPAYWEYIHEINQHIAIPVIANGEVWSVEDYFRCRDASGSNDIMLGRGLLAKPDLAIAIKHAVQNGQDQPQYSQLTWQEVAEHVHEFFNQTRYCYPKKYLGNRVKQWLYYLKQHYPQAHDLFDQIKRTRDENTLEKAIIQHANCA